MATIKQEKQVTETKTNGDELVRNEKGQFVNGHPNLGAGRPQGVRDFTTDFEEAITEMAEEKGITFSEARKDLLKVAYSKAKEGNFPYHKDIMDRYYQDSVPEADKGDTYVINPKIQIIVNKFEEEYRKELEK